MPPRLLILPSIQPPIPFIYRHSCLFHTSRVLNIEGVIDHYKTLGLEFNASSSDIKKNFYALSKKHHPDRNPNDSHAAERFVEISEAYAVLGNPPKRAKYDRETQRVTSGGSQHPPRGSHSSSAPYGARPATGLSKRRTQFRGPPPSFYRSGGWGRYGAKRQQQADATASAHANATFGSGSTGTPAGGGFGPGGASEGLDNDVPHFDREGHIRTQEQQDQRRGRRVGEVATDYSTGGNIVLNFFLVSGILALTILIPTVIVRRRHPRQSNDDAG
ncbi:MAG: hypothetical protein Q9225_002776 [Loekoesia sp. 1 TL-2023]